jgi:malonyl CoA-acyl carrier protein transacylase
MTAGHSLGEYSALVAAEAITFEDGLRLVRLRGELMQQAGEEQKGTMAAILGLLPEAIEDLCKEASSAGIVQPANFNSPGQIVISGSIEGIRKGMELAKAKGAKLVKELVVSGAFHSPLMASASNGLKRKLDETNIVDASIPVYANVTAESVTKASDIRNLLFRQLTSPVRWEESVIHMVRDGATDFIEVGPGKVLQGLVKRIASNVQTSLILYKSVSEHLLKIKQFSIANEFFEKGYPAGFSPCTCSSNCCKGGVWTDIKERDVILDHREMIAQYMDESQTKDHALWFEKHVSDDADFPSGKTVGTEVINDKCAFLDKSGRCSIQVASVENGMHKWELKPLYCILFPIEVSNNVVGFDTMLQGEDTCCTVSSVFETPLYQACKDELTHLLGEDGYRALDEHYESLKKTINVNN